MEKALAAVSSSNLASSSETALGNSRWPWYPKPNRRGIHPGREVKIALQQLQDEKSTAITVHVCISEISIDTSAFVLRWPAPASPSALLLSNDPFADFFSTVRSNSSHLFCLCINPFSFFLVCRVGARERCSLALAFCRAGLGRVRGEALLNSSNHTDRVEGEECDGQLSAAEYRPISVAYLRSEPDEVQGVEGDVAN